MCVKNLLSRLAGVAQKVESSPVHPKVAGLFLVRAHMEGNHVSHSHNRGKRPLSFLPLSLPPLSKHVLG